MDNKWDYGPKGSLWVSPKGEVWRFQGTRLAGWDKDKSPYYTHQFEVWANEPNTIQNRVNGRGVFELPVGSVRVWTPDGP